MLDASCHSKCYNCCKNLLRCIRSAIKCVIIILSFSTRLRPTPIVCTSDFGDSESHFINILYFFFFFTFYAPDRIRFYIWCEFDIRTANFSSSIGGSVCRYKSLRDFPSPAALHTAPPPPPPPPLKCAQKTKRWRQRERERERENDKLDRKQMK